MIRVVTDGEDNKVDGQMDRIIYAFTSKNPKRKDDKIVGKTRWGQTA